jgi:hypothetical protein
VFQAQHVQGQDISSGLSDAVKAGMGAAFKMSRGEIPKVRWDSGVLALATAPVAEPAKVVQNGSKTPVPQNAAVARTAKGEIPRPKRSVKKRSYADSSFEGYGEGFVDDDNQETYSSTGEGDDRAGRKRPKKVGSLLLLQDFVANKNTKDRSFPQLPRPDAPKQLWARHGWSLKIEHMLPSLILEAWLPEMASLFTPQYRKHPALMSHYSLVSG